MRSPESDDWQLLNEYASQRSEGAFRVLVDRYAGMVYHAALRQTGDPHLAQEITQAVFIALAQKAGSLSRNVLIGGWLFRATRYAALNLARAERSRRAHEAEAVAMQATVSAAGESSPAWEQITPYLDEALAALASKDREAIIGRYFGNKSHKETALFLGVSEDAAKKRVARALEKLRLIFAKIGVAIPAAAIAAALAASSAKAVPSGLAAMAASVALKHAAGGVISSPVIAGSILSAMGQARVKTLVLTCCVIVLFAFLTGNFVVRSIRSPPAQVVAPTVKPPDPPPGRIVVWDKRLPLPPTVTVADATLEQALDRVAVPAGAYWSVDYVVYDSDIALRRLLDVFRSGESLQSCGWTNLGGAAQKAGSGQCCQ